MARLDRLPPDRLFALFEQGEIEREELQALLAIQARDLIAEMEEDHLNPAAAFLEHLRNRRAAGKLVRRHGARLIRDTFTVLAGLDDFPPAMQLWNVSHPDVPLHCFFRSKRQPVFRVKSLRSNGTRVEMEVEYGRGEVTCEQIVLKRDEHWKLQLESRSGVPTA